MYLCGSLDVLQVAGDEAGLLLLVVVRHCDMCDVVALVVEYCFVLIVAMMYKREGKECGGQLY